MAASDDGAPFGSCATSSSVRIKPPVCARTPRISLRVSELDTVRRFDGSGHFFGLPAGAGQFHVEWNI
jgi:hypothetical protein